MNNSYKLINNYCYSAEVFKKGKYWYQSSNYFSLKTFISACCKLQKMIFPLFHRHYFSVKLQIHTNQTSNQKQKQFRLIDEIGPIIPSQDIDANWNFPEIKQEYKQAFIYTQTPFMLNLNDKDREVNSWMQFKNWFNARHLVKLIVNILDKFEGTTFAWNNQKIFKNKIIKLIKSKFDIQNIVNQNQLQRTFYDFIEQLTQITNSTKINYNSKDKRAKQKHQTQLLEHNNQYIPFKIPTKQKGQTINNCLQQQILFSPLAILKINNFQFQEIQLQYYNQLIQFDLPAYN